MIDFKTSSPDRYGLLKEFARENRKNPTLAEQVLWEHIRAGQLGMKVLRQHVIGDYIVDFLLPEIKLVIEVDGTYHAERDQKDDDEIRERNLARMNYSIIRFSNEEVLHNIENTLEIILREIESYE